MFDHCFIIVSSSIVCTVAASPWNLCLYTEPQRIASPPRTLVEDRLSPGWMRTIFFQRRPSLGCCFLRIAGENVSYFNRFSLQKNVRPYKLEMKSIAMQEKNQTLGSIQSEFKLRKNRMPRKQKASKYRTWKTPLKDVPMWSDVHILTRWHMDVLRNVMKCAISVIAIPQNSRGHSKVGK